MIPYIHSEKQAELDFMHNIAYTDAYRWARNRIEGLSGLLDQSMESERILREELRQANKKEIMLREALTPLVIHRHSTNDSEYRAAEKALAATQEGFQTEKEQGK